MTDEKPCEGREVLIGARRYTVSCQHGFTHDDLERQFGAKVGQPHPLWKQLGGQTGILCRVHGPVSYVGDVAEWVRGAPVSDW